MTPKPATGRPMRSDDIVYLRSVEDPQVSPDGTAVAYVVVTPRLAENRYDRRIWIQSLKDDDAQPLTGGGKERLVRWAPNGKNLTFVSDSEDGWSEIFSLPTNGVGERQLVARWWGRITEVQWSPDGSKIAFLARTPDETQYGAAGSQISGAEMPARRLHRLIYRLNGVGWTFDRPVQLYVLNADGDTQPRALTEGPWSVEGLAWSPTSEEIAFVSARHDDSDLDLCNDLWTVEVANRSNLKRLTNSTTALHSPAWSPDGSKIAYYLNPTPLESPRHKRIAVFELASNSQTVLTSELDRTCSPFGSPTSPCWSNSAIVFGVEDQGNVHLYGIDSFDSGSAPERLVDGDVWVSEWSVSGNTLAYVASSATTLPELFVRTDFVPHARSFGLGTAIQSVSDGGRSDDRLVTKLSEALVNEIDVAEPIEFTAISSDGSAVQCWALLPRGFEAGRSYPTLLNVHGGPFTQYGNHLFDEFQFQSAAGFGVLYCNPRGSSGYSEAWGRAIRFPQAKSDPGSGWGGVDFQDVMACVDEAMRRFDWIDEDRLGILGGSYGGYMTSWAIGHTDRFKAALSERACNNLLTMEHSADIAGFVRSYVGVSHLDDPGAYMDHSPVNFLKAIKTPTLILHSELDLRCPIAQAEELFVGLRLLGQRPEFVRFVDETHELTRSGSPKHRKERAEIVLEWFSRHLK